MATVSDLDYLKFALNPVLRRRLLTVARATS